MVQKFGCEGFLLRFDERARHSFGMEKSSGMVQKTTGRQPGRRLCWHPESVQIETLALATTGRQVHHVTQIVTFLQLPFLPPAAPVTPDRQAPGVMPPAGNEQCVKAGTVCCWNRQARMAGSGRDAPIGRALYDECMSACNKACRLIVYKKTNGKAA